MSVDDMTFNLPILIDNFSVKFRVKIEKINISDDFNKNIFFFIQFVILSDITLIIMKI